MAFSIGSFTSTLGLDTGGFARGMLQAESISRVFGDTFASFVANPVLGFADIASQAARGAVRLGGEILNDAEAVTRLADQTGFTVETIQALSKEFERLTGDGESARDVMTELAIKLGEARREGGPVAEMLREMGIELEGVGTTEDVFRRIIDRLAEMDDVTAKAAARSALFGDDIGIRLGQALQGGSDALDGMISRYDRLGFVIDDRGIRRLANFNQSLDTVDQAFAGVARNGMAEFLLGFAGAGDIAGDFEEQMGRLNREVGRTARELGQAIREITGDLEALTAQIDRVRAIGQAANEVPSAFDYRAWTEIITDSFGTMSEEELNRPFADSYLEHKSKMRQRYGGGM